jgi:2-phospho-L-lactate guanylyltransferase
MIAAIVPVKTLATAKGRLARLLTAPERRALMQAMIEDVLSALLAARGVERVGVISPDPVVLGQAAMCGAEPLLDRASELNGALAQAAHYYAAEGAGKLLVVHADLPLVAPTEIEQMIAESRESPGAVLAPSRDGGTNALLVAPPQALPFRFGAHSLAQHVAAARERNVDLRLFHRPGLELDIDRPDDLWLLAETAGNRIAQELARELSVYDRMAYV